MFVLAEFEYMLEEANILAGRIIQVPLDRFDGEIVYRERWIPSINYCLSITIFSKEHCHKIAVPVERALLPKLGFNRYVPKVVLYGPTKFGCKQMMHVHTE